MKRRKVSKLRELSPDDDSGSTAPRQETMPVARFRELSDKRLGRRTRSVVVPADTTPVDHAQEGPPDNVEPDVDHGSAQGMGARRVWRLVVQWMETSGMLCKERARKELSG